MAITPQELFNERVPKGLAANPDKARETPLILQFNVTGDNGGSWTVDTLNEPASCVAGVREDAQCTIQITDEALQDLLRVEAMARPQVVMKHVIEGSIEIDGDVTVAMKLSKVFNIADAGGNQ